MKPIKKKRFNNGEGDPKETMKLISIRSLQLLLYKMKLKKEDKNVTTDTITMSNGRI